MSYTCGSNGSLAKWGLPAGPPRVTCDGCGTVIVARTRNGGPPMWLLDGKPPSKGWKTIRHENYTRTDYCPNCLDRAGRKTDV